VSLVSEEEIREIECSQTIVEENEDEESEEDEKPSTHPAKHEVDSKAAVDKKSSLEKSDEDELTEGSPAKSDKGEPKVLGKVLDKMHIKHEDGKKDG
jgi:hypothetical protein